MADPYSSAGKLSVGRSEIACWQDRIKNGLRFQTKVGRSDEWHRYKSYYRHNFPAGSLPVNMMFSVLRSLTPQIVLRNPKITVTPRKSGPVAELNARIVQKLSNWMLYELMTKRELKKIVTDCFFAGTATGFIGYDSQFGFDSSLADSTGQYSMTQFGKNGDRIETNTGVNPGMPWFLRCRPEDVVFPWGATDAESLEWVAMRVFRRVSDLKQDKKYENAENLTGSVTPIRTTAEGGQIVDYKDNPDYSPDPEAQWVELWQVHDARTGKVLALTMDHDKLLRKEKDEMQITGLPSETVSFNPDPDYIYGVPDARIIEPQLLELLDIRTQSMRHRSVDIIKGLIKKGAISDTELQKLTNGKIGAMVEVDGDVVDIRSVFAPVNPGVSGILNDLAAQGQLTQGDIREMVGFSRAMSGEYQGKSHVSAAETEAVFRAANIRLDERRDAMADYLSKIVRRWHQYIFTYWTDEHVESIIGPDGAKWWLKFTGPQIKDEYDLIIEPEEGQGLDTQTKRQTLLEVADIWAKLNAGAIAQGQPVPPEIQRALFGQFDDLGLDVDRLIAQTTALGAQSQLQSQLQGMGASADNPISPQSLGNIQAARGGR